MGRGRRLGSRAGPATPAGPDGSLVGDLVAVLGADRVRTGSLERSLYASDASTVAGEATAVCFPASTSEVAACVRVLAAHGRAFVPRGSGTGLAGGAVPLDGAVVLATTRMNRVLSVDAEARVAWVEPGVLNLDLSRAVAGHGLHFAPDPSSQQASSVGGNAATNAGGPHCLASGVTSTHVLAVEVVLPDGEVVLLGGTDPDPAGLDLRGAFVGSEGCFGVATRLAVRLSPLPPAVRLVLAGFPTVDAAAATVGDVIAGGLVPAAMEMMDARITGAVEDYVGAGYPRDAAAVLLVEVDGLPGGVDAGVEAVVAAARARGATSVRVAADGPERALLWKGRKAAFGALARIAPDYALHDTVVPRRRLPEVLRAVYRAAEAQGLLVVNVFHAGDGNLHPILVFDRREPGVAERVEAAGRAIVEASLAAGGVLSGEHGIGMEKRDLMGLLFTPADLDAQAGIRAAFDPAGRANPHKVLPSGSRCGEVAGVVAAGVWV